MGALSLTPVTLRAAKAFCAHHHRHHKLPEIARFAAGLERDGRVIACAIVGNPKAAALDADPRCCEVVRLTSIGAPEENACSRLYAACARAWLAIGGHRLVTYIRHDEPGTSLRAAGWWPTARVKAEGWDRRAEHAARAWLPGMYEPSTAPVDRVRWEFGPAAQLELGELAHLGRRRRAA